MAYHTWLTQQASKRTGEPLKPGTVNDRFQMVRKLYSCMYRARLIPENPTHGLKVEMADPGGWKRRPLSKAEITQFLDSIDTGSAQGLKDRTLFELIYSSGLRVNEAASLKVADIDFERRFIVVRGKFDRNRKVPISEVASAFLKRYGMDKPEISNHSIRHSTATHPREHELFEGVGEEYIRRLQAVVGHVPSRNEGDSQETS